MAFNDASEEFWTKNSSKTFFPMDEDLSKKNIDSSLVFDDISNMLGGKTPPRMIFSTHNGNSSSLEVRTPKNPSAASKIQSSNSPFVGFAVSSTPNISQSFEFSDGSSSAPSFFENSLVNHVSNENSQENASQQSASSARGLTNGLSSENKSRMNYSRFAQNESFGGVKLRAPQRPPTSEPIFNLSPPNVNGRAPRHGVRKARRSLTTKAKENTNAIGSPVFLKDESDKKQIASKEKANDQPSLADSFIKLNISGDQVKDHATQMNRNEDLASLENNIAKLTSLLRELDGVRALNDMRTVSMMVQSLEKTVQSVRNVFKCEICFSPQYSYFYFCPDCGRMVGCYTCAYQIDRCSTCRKRLPVRKNRVPHFIPGLAVALDENEITRDELKKKIEKLP